MLISNHLELKHESLATYYYEVEVNIEPFGIETYYVLVDHDYEESLISNHLELKRGYDVAPQRCVDVNIEPFGIETPEFEI